MGRPRLIFVNRFFHPDESATSQILSDLCFHLAHNGWEVIVVTGRLRAVEGVPAVPSREKINGVEVRRCWRTHFESKYRYVGRGLDFVSFFVGSLVALLAICRRGDLLIAKTDPPLLSVAVYICARLKRAKLINWLQDLYPEVAIELGVAQLQGRVGRLLISFRNESLKQAEANVVIGRLMAQRLIAMGVDERRVCESNNWADEKAIVPISIGSSQRRREWGLPESAFVLGYSGNLGRAHEAQTILSAMHLLRHRLDIIFLFIGGGVQSARLQDELATQQLSNFVFKPHQPRDWLSDTLGAADAHWLSLRPQLEGLIVPSKFYGIAAAGRPLIAVTSKKGEIAAAVDELACGIVVEPDDGPGLARAICQLADDQSLRVEMGRRARQASEGRYARANAFAQWETLLARVAEGQIAPCSPVEINAQ